MTGTDPLEDLAVLDTPAPALTIDEARSLALRSFGIDGDVAPLASERDQNFRVDAGEDRSYVLKIANPAEHPDVLAFQAAALRHIEVQSPTLPVPRVVPAVDGHDLATIDSDGRRCRARLVTFLEGRPLAESEPGPVLRQDIGVMLARLGRALSDLHVRPPERVLLWDLSHAGRLKALVKHIDDPSVRRLARGVLDDFETHAVPWLPSLRTQVIHNDFNRDNLLIGSDDRHPIGGIIDFGDMVRAPLVNDLAIATAYQLIGEQDPITAAADLINGYANVRPLVEEEISILYDLVAARMAQSLTIGAWRASLHPDNAEYILTDQGAFRDALARWRTRGRNEVTDSLRAVCGLPGRRAVAAGLVPMGTLAERRRKSLGPALRLSYDVPLHVVRGEGVWLYDAEGKAFLDAYNNVACVGHGHPAVVAALTRQARTLNTNTRYLHGHIVEYAERLTATLPDPLSVCLFVCTGTEANDLAWQIARACTGHDGAIVTEHAYHGNSVAVSQLSPEELAPGLQEDWVATVPAPNVYSGPFRSANRVSAEMGERYAACLDEAIATLEGRGHRPAGFMVDTIYTSDGIMIAPDGYLAGAWRRVREAGGLCIADEVQAGFGRTGGCMWGFQQQGVVPDIVTLGKPIGNGHPLAAVITTPAIAERFAERRYYFNTFGGNPVSCAVGLAVLDVVQRERLVRNASEVGEYLHTAIRGMMSRHPVIGDVRGAGLMIGVELVGDRETRDPASDAALRVMNFMRERGVLIGRSGLHGQVLKIRPPLVFSRGDADRLIEELDESLAAARQA